MEVALSLTKTAWVHSLTPEQVRASYCADCIPKTRDAYFSGSPRFLRQLQTVMFLVRLPLARCNFAFLLKTKACLCILATSQMHCPVLISKYLHTACIHYNIHSLAVELLQHASRLDVSSTKGSKGYETLAQQAVPCIFTLTPTSLSHNLLMGCVNLIRIACSLEAATALFTFVDNWLSVSNTPSEKSDHDLAEALHFAHSELLTYMALHPSKADIVLLHLSSQLVSLTAIPVSMPSIYHSHLATYTETLSSLQMCGPSVFMRVLVALAVGSWLSASSRILYPS